VGYGKHWEDMYTGTMMGAGSDVFAVWGYIISKMRVSNEVARMEINPVLLAVMLGMTEGEVRAAIAILEAPDPRSRSKEADGRRLVAETEDVGGPTVYRVVNGYKYRMMPGEEQRKEKGRERQRRYQAKKDAARAEAEAKAAEWDREGLDKPLGVQRPMKREWE
jgi:hypothetical protein